MKDALNSGKGEHFLPGFGQFCLAVLLLLGHTSKVDAGNLYRWTDGEGRTHFGDRPPNAEVERVEELKMPSFAVPNRPADEDPYSILNQLGRLEASRQKLERDRQERAKQEREYYLRKRELDALERAADRPAGRPAYGYPRPVYPAYPIHPPVWPDHRPGWPDRRPRSRIDEWYAPDHPIYRPGPHPPVAVPLPHGGGAGINLRR